MLTNQLAGNKNDHDTPPHYIDMEADKDQLPDVISEEQSALEREMDDNEDDVHNQTGGTACFENDS